MGLMDILNGMQNGPRGAADPNDKSGGMSKFTMAILALLAYKAYKHVTTPDAQAPAGQGRTTSVPSSRPPLPRDTVNAGMPGGGSGGGLSDLLKGGLGGLLAGGAAGSILSGGLGDLMKQFQTSGLGDAAESWVGRGENKPIGPNDLANALGADQLDMLTQQTGMSRDELLDGLSRQLPQFVDQLTPDGRLPTEDEASRWV
ncbi:YidB family protein [Rhodopseudomonas palustris]|uniref:YidB family protein n=1 Tax=Rhodopseudomonas palustris TaxID=1076 RepID=UPI002ACE5DFF|nr:YidB family protein [Rhodopseudomonas palustris]WQG98493.1 YidB family protein [Rhodopseudomonas palustris]